MEKNFIRAFFAIGFDAKTQTSLAAIISTLQTIFDNNNIRWIPPENLHITLQFIAQLNNNDIVKLIELTHHKIKNISSFDLYFKEIELFPSPYAAKVISIKVDPEKNLWNLSKLIGESLHELNYPPEKRIFKAHLSLGRINDVEKKKITLPILNLPEIKPISIEKVILFESKPSESGMKYIVLNEFPLGL